MLPLLFAVSHRFSDFAELISAALERSNRTFLELN